MNETEFKQKTKISKIMMRKLNIYLKILSIWQRKFNLISNKSFEFIWERHILDSYQILKIIGTNKKILDIGSGAGFPSIVCAICSNNYFDLVESTKKKENFLNEVKKKLHLKNITIHHSRVENLKINKNFDFITARAVGSLSNLIKFSIKFCKNKTRCIFLKGKSVDNEIKIAKKKFIFQISYQKSITNKEGKILIIENIRKK